MSLRWYVNRLASMGPREVVHRVGEQAKRRLARRRAYGWAAFPPPALAPLPGLRGGILSGATPALRAAVAASAGRLLAGEFAALGIAWPRRDPDALFPDTIWRLDPVTGGLWPGPERYCFDIGFRHAGALGDVKYVWDLNRLQFLQPLAAHVALADDARALAAIEAAIVGWARANPPFQGLAWASGIELALRATSLLVVDALCGERLAAGTRTLLARVLAAHRHWLGRYPSRFSSANNHLMAEALGLFLVGGALGDPSVEAHGRRILEGEAGRQILPDGIGAEQSPTYAAFTAEMLLLADTVATAGGKPLAPVVRARLHAFADGVAWLAGPDGRLPSLGDDDEGRVLTLCDPREAAYPASVARAIAARLGTASAVPTLPDAPELRDALFGTPAPALAPAGLRSFPRGGLSVVRERRAGRALHLVLDHGPLGYLAIAAHGHADANALVLALDGRPVIVDPGTYLYQSGGPWRDWFRGTRAHATLTLGDVDSSVISGPFNWSHKAMARLDEARLGPDWRIAASHDGYLRRFGVRHARTLEARPDGIAIHDALPGRATAPEAEVAFPLAPGLVAEGAGLTWTVHDGERPMMSVTFSDPGTVSACAGGRLGQGGWVSPAFGTKVAAVRLVWRGRVPARGLLTTLAWR